MKNEVNMKHVQVEERVEKKNLKIPQDIIHNPILPDGVWNQTEFV